MVEFLLFLFLLRVPMPIPMRLSKRPWSTSLSATRWPLSRVTLCSVMFT